MKSFWKKSWWLLSFVCLFLASDLLLTWLAPVERSDYFPKNDYQKVILQKDGEKEFNKVFYGNSVVTCGYLEAESVSGYVNLGISYGKMQDIYLGLKHGDIVTRDLVVGMNYLTYLDTLDTDFSYPWYREWYQPYLYFQRDKLYAFFSTGAENLLKGEPFAAKRYDNYNRSLASGHLSGKEIEEKVESHRELYWGLGLENYQDNLAYAEKLVEYCREHDIRLRVLWMPWRNDVEMPDTVKAVMEQANSIFERSGIEVHDMTDALTVECFNDIGHLNQEYGMSVFTKEVDPWLIQ